MKFRFRILLIAFVSGTSLILLSMGDATPQAPGPDVYRFEHVYGGGKTVSSMSCGSFDCAFQTVGAISVRFPSSMGTIDVTVSMTIEYQTTSGDDALVRMEMRPPGAGSRFATMAPGEYALDAGGPTTTTLVWFRGGLEASERAYRFGFGLDAGKQATLPLTIEAREVVLVVEAVPSA